MRIPLLFEKNIGLCQTASHVREAEVAFYGREIVSITLSSHEKESFFFPTTDATCITALPTHESLLRPLSLSLKKKRDVDAVLPFEAEPLLPFPFEEAVIDRIIHKTTDEGTLLAISACRTDRLAQHLENWRSYAVEPERVTTTPAALASFAQLFPTAAESRFLVYIGAEEIACLLLAEGKLLAAFAVQQENLEPNPLILSLIKILYALEKQHPNTKPQEILLCGEKALSLASYQEWSDRLPHPIVLPAAPTSLSVTDRDLLEYALPIGIALNGAVADTNSCNFRKEAWAFPHSFRKVRQPLLFSGVLALLTTLSFFLFSTAYLRFERAKIKQEYGDLIHVIRMTDLPPPSSVHEIEAHLISLEKELKKQPFPFPLLPNTPGVSDTLAWLVNHPAFVATDPENNERSSLLRLEHFSYSLVKRPDLSKKGEKYQAKVEIEFTTSLPKQARAFHDALIEPNEIVDNKNEIQWNAQRGKYRTSFFLKDKTIYPDRGVG